METETIRRICSAPFHEEDFNISRDNTKLINDAQNCGVVVASDIEAIMKGVEAYKSVAETIPSANEYHGSLPCLVAADARARASLEQDFTTNGVQGNLHCPYAIPNDSTPRQQANGDIEACGHEGLDPIKAELHPDHPSSRSVSARSSIPRCPIRFLENHSPEEVAQYFENHKHEIPRSHAVCVQRYQKDSQSVRQLDEKYGNMVNMIKGLGLYHQPYLQEHERAGDPDKSSAERVEKWAEDLSARSPKINGLSAGQETDANMMVDEERQSHFERPLKDVRVGESPSRPWGIHVPIALDNAQSAFDSPAAPAVTNAPQQPPVDYDRLVSDKSSISTPVEKRSQPPQGKSRCPFHTGTLKVDAAPNGVDESQATGGADVGTEGNEAKQDIPSNVATAQQIAPSRSESPTKPPLRSNMVFNGPVFFGYSADDAATLMQQLANANTPK